jgi:hypothetical protein
MHRVRVTVNNNCMRLLSVLHIGITFCRRAVLVFGQKKTLQLTHRPTAVTRDYNTVAERRV